MAVRSSLKMLLLAGVAGILCAAAPARAQDYGRLDDRTSTSSDTEQVIVIAPHYRGERNTLGMPGKLSLSQEVSYRDLDLRTGDGARAFRTRVDETAHDVCRQLQEAYPLKEQPLEHCYTNTYRDAMVRADAAIRDARNSEYYRAGYRGEDAE